MLREQLVALDDDIRIGRDGVPPEIALNVGIPTSQGDTSDDGINE